MEYKSNIQEVVDKIKADLLKATQPSELAKQLANEFSETPCPHCNKLMNLEVIGNQIHLDPCCLERANEMKQMNKKG